MRLKPFFLWRTGGVFIVFLFMLFLYSSSFFLEKILLFSFDIQDIEHTESNFLSIKTHTDITFFRLLEWIDTFYFISFFSIEKKNSFEGKIIYHSFLYPFLQALKTNVA